MLSSGRFLGYGHPQQAVLQVWQALEHCRQVPTLRRRFQFLQHVDTLWCEHMRYIFLWTFTIAGEIVPECCHHGSCQNGSLDEHGCEPAATCKCRLVSPVQWRNSATVGPSATKGLQFTAPLDKKGPSLDMRSEPSCGASAKTRKAAATVSLGQSQKPIPCSDAVHG